eukprot:CAMPEP_0202380154 /NCGR_PEP_ID=MMETSP1127-20130417/27386_1 /ASSEMBLY_ACC=CAM_ASM_000462 /TAXON_ID=3047 /ORGANISM="Dunaliella tertiolecta, Strain CCMP1320" /LENGTH=1087 /DNA_ID=CAMNT_0048978807 /DNA_START=79 /DNA_END=3342 /DNA_ORIENTATION=+
MDMNEPEQVHLRAFPLVALRLFGDASFQPKQGKSRPRSLHIQANLKNPGSPSQSPFPSPYSLGNSRKHQLTHPETNGGLLEQSRRSQSYQQLHSLQTLQMPHHIPSVMKSAPQLPPLSSPASPIAASATLETPPWGSKSIAKHPTVATCHSAPGLLPMPPPEHLTPVAASASFSAFHTNRVAFHQQSHNSTSSATQNNNPHHSTDATAPSDSPSAQSAPLSRLAPLTHPPTIHHSSSRHFPQELPISTNQGSSHHLEGGEVSSPFARSPSLATKQLGLFRAPSHHLAPLLKPAPSKRRSRLTFHSPAISQPEGTSQGVAPKEPCSELSIKVSGSPYLPPNFTATGLSPRTQDGTNKPDVWTRLSSMSHLRRAPSFRTHQGPQTPSSQGNTLSRSSTNRRQSRSRNGSRGKGSLEQAANRANVQLPGAQGLWSKLRAKMKDKKITSKGLASAFLSHIQDNNFDEEAMASLVEAARSRATRSFSSSNKLPSRQPRGKGGAEEPESSPRRPWPSAKAALRIADEDDDETESLITPLERESMTAREQKIWAMSQGAIRRMQLMKANPVAFDESAAQAAEAEARAAAEYARKRFEELKLLVSDSRANEQFRDAIQNVMMNRPHFVRPMASKRSIQPRATVVERDVQGWRLEDSIFMKRVKENDARNAYDTPEVVDKQFETDWSRVSSKVRFRKLVTRQDSGLRDQAELDRELREVHDELQKRFTAIRASFIYFSSFSGSTASDSMMEMGLMEFHRFARHCKISDPKVPGIKPSDIDTMFISTNYEEDSQTQESEANDDNALVRFELLEIIVRMAIGKFIVPKVLTDVSDSVAHMFENFIEPSLPAVAKTDPNSFRRDRFYCKEMEMEIVKHWELLQATFKLYKAKDRTKMFWIEHWIALLESTNLLGTHTGIDKHCSKVLFAFSQSTVVDELKRRQRAVSLMFCDFLEALARISEVLSPPTAAELADFARELQYGSDISKPTAISEESDQDSAISPESGDAGKEAPRTLTVAEYFKLVQSDPVKLATRAAKAGLGKELHQAAQQRPLAESFAGLIEMMLAGLQETWGGTTEAQTAARMQKMAQGLSGGIELR